MYKKIMALVFLWSMASLSGATLQQLKAEKDDITEVGISGIASGEALERLGERLVAVDGEIEKLRGEQASSELAIRLEAEESALHQARLAREAQEAQDLAMALSLSGQGGGAAGGAAPSRISKRQGPAVAAGAAGGAALLQKKAIVPVRFDERLEQFFVLLQKEENKNNPGNFFFKLIHMNSPIVKALHLDTTSIVQKMPLLFHRYS